MCIARGSCRCEGVASSSSSWWDLRQRPVTTKKKKKMIITICRDHNVAVSVDIIHHPNSYGRVLVCIIRLMQLLLKNVSGSSVERQTEERKEMLKCQYIESLTRLYINNRLVKCEKGWVTFLENKPLPFKKKAKQNVWIYSEIKIQQCHVRLKLK